MASVLVVEDEFAQRKLFCEILRDDGYQVIGVDDGEKALEVLEHMPVDLVVMDLIFPEGEGFRYLDEIKSHYHNLKIIINSGFPGLIKDTRTRPAERFVVKSSDLSELKNAVAELAATC